MTDLTFEYKILRFLNDRFELYDISERALKIVFFDVTQYQYDQEIKSLREKGYVKNKDLYEKGLSITTEGQVRLNQLQTNLDSASLKSKSPIGIKKYFQVNGKSYTIGTGTFWVALPIICSVAFFLGTVKYDADKISLDKKNVALEETIKLRDAQIVQMRKYSDSALNVLSHIPYNEMTLDAHSFRKVQTTIENAGAILILNK